MKNYPIKIETGEHAGETVWVHRSIAVVGFVFCKINNEWCVLANQRGEGAPEDSIIEESIGDEIVLTLKNGFSREVTFYERN